MTQPFRLKDNHPSKVKKEMTEKPPTLNMKCLCIEMFAKLFSKCCPCVAKRKNREEKVPLAPRSNDED